MSFPVEDTNVNKICQWFQKEAMQVEKEIRSATNRETQQFALSKLAFKTQLALVSLGHHFEKLDPSTASEKTEKTYLEVLSKIKINLPTKEKNFESSTVGQALQEYNENFIKIAVQSVPRKGSVKSEETDKLDEIQHCFQEEVAKTNDEIIERHQLKQKKLTPKRLGVLTCNSIATKAHSAMEKLVKYYLKNDPEKAYEKAKKAFDERLSGLQVAITTKDGSAHFNAIDELVPNYEESLKNITEDSIKKTKLSKKKVTFKKENEIIHFHKKRSTAPSDHPVHVKLSQKQMAAVKGNIEKKIAKFRNEKLQAKARENFEELSRSFQNELTTNSKMSKKLSRSVDIIHNMVDKAYKKLSSREDLSDSDKFFHLVGQLRAVMANALDDVRSDKMLHSELDAFLKDLSLWKLVDQYEAPVIKAGRRGS